MFVFDIICRDGVHPVSTYASMEQGEQFIHDFLEKLIDEAEQGGVSDNLRQDMMASLTQRLNAYIGTAIFQEFSSQDAKDFEKLIENHDFNSQEVQSFLHERIPSIDEIMAKTMMEFRDIYLNS